MTAATTTLTRGLVVYRWHGELRMMNAGTTLDQARRNADEHAATSGVTDVHAVVVNRTVTVGDTVGVAAFGRNRKGTVTKVGGSRVTVRYSRNAEGDLDERAFTVGELVISANERADAARATGVAI